MPSNVLGEVLHEQQDAILRDWLEQQAAAIGIRRDSLSQADLREQSRQFLSLFTEATRRGGDSDVDAAAYTEVRRFLEELSSTRARGGYPPSESAMFIFSLKQPVFARLRDRYGADSQGLADALWNATLRLDRLGLLTTEYHQRGREQVIVRQQEEMMELSTPVVTLWDGVLALPLIGTLDSARTQVVMENLLQRVVATGSSLAVIDITGVPTVDTVTAQHLMKTIAAARLMGAECILSGIRPQIAQTIVHLGVDLGSVVTKATLADAFAVALKRLGLTVQRVRQEATRATHTADQEQEKTPWNASRS